MDSDKPAILSEKTEAVPSPVPTPSIEKAVVDDEVGITGTLKGYPPAQNVLVKTSEGKKQVVSLPYESISEKTSVEELYKRSLACSTERHDIILHFWRCYEIFLHILSSVDFE